MQIKFGEDTDDETIAGVLRALTGWSVGAFTTDDDAEPVEGDILSVEVTDVACFVSIGKIAEPDLGPPEVIEIGRLDYVEVL